ncbi:hypothetical protein BDF21DRAFT_397261 [Thamnidium elegans]|nr:hypothetical protein BDF21DRAFT_397261 [Thamnidium elegans]
MSNHKTVKLNIEGAFFETAQETLRDSGYFCGLLNQDWAEGDATNDTIFVDRDGSLFRFVLFYLLLAQLKNEADFYLLPKLSQLIERATRPRVKHPDYKLLDHEEFIRMSTINVRDAIASINIHGTSPKKEIL